MLLESKAAAGRKADNLSADCEPTLKRLWDPQHLTTDRLPRSETRIASLLYM
jgi:hypothetical protein